MHEKRASKEDKKHQLDQFIDQVEQKGGALPTMEDLAGTSLLKQISHEEKRGAEATRLSRGNRTGATLSTSQ